LAAAAATHETMTAFTPTAPTATDSEAAAHADFSMIRYAQCWEDADVLLAALNPPPGARCLSIASAGDNTLSLLANDPERVTAVDLNPSQLACLALRVAAYRELEHPELLELMGSRDSTRRMALYRKCRPQLEPAALQFWDAHPALIETGIGGAGRFERYFATFRTKVLPLVHDRSRITQLLTGGSPEIRRRFYDSTWNTWRWRMIFHLFFSRFVMGRMGRDPSFFRYVEGSVASRIIQRAEHAATALDPSNNPYLHWILTGKHGDALPHALQPDVFEKIRRNLDRLEWHCESLESFLGRTPPGSFDAFNLSDIFEYMAEDRFHHLLAQLTDRARPGARMAWWNTLAHRRRPDSMSDRLRSLTGLAEKLHHGDRAFFYCAFWIEEVLS
jgi:S-adenosylmethionine-diacylglycerol 3-amino-3-carboxypropyl transferase